MNNSCCNNGTKNKKTFENIGATLGTRQNEDNQNKNTPLKTKLLSYTEILPVIIGKLTVGKMKYVWSL